MHSFIARQPIVNASDHIVAYELLFRTGLQNKYPSIDPEQATSRVLIEHFFLTNVQGYDDTLYLVNFPYQSLLNQIPTLFPAKYLMIEILEDCPPSDALLAAIINMHQQGYKIALDDFIPSKKWERFLPYITAIKFDIKQISIKQAKQFIDTHQHYSLQYLAEKIDSLAELKAAREAGFDYFQGYELYKPEIIKKKRIESSEFTVEQLELAIQQSPIDFHLIARLIRHDVTMSYKLMRFVHAHLNEPFRSFEQAFQLLGEEKIQLFISLSLTAAHDPDPSPHYETSMQRAHFCEQVAALPQFNINIEHAYYVGMFSLLDKLLEHPLSDLIATLPLESSAITALLTQQGTLGKMLALAIAYENNDKSSILKQANELQLELDQINRFYRNAIDWSTPEYHHLRLQGNLAHQL
ncbi:EAL and HDOD domain-containing protein [Vibrio aphrogenes]|uniref:EAL and HDOD domain-containing protein n=1 Tax=Vibrio aphrogenes TaxID=1891186 RepID=UPI000B3502DF|nr:EAL domain-containing protein [Vibrio aphrogenes]